MLTVREIETLTESFESTDIDRDALERAAYIAAFDAWLLSTGRVYPASAEVVELDAVTYGSTVVLPASATVVSPLARTVRASLQAGTVRARL